MRHSAHEEKLTRLIAPALETLGLSLWGLSASSGGRSRAVRVYIEKDGGVGVDDCAQASRHIGALLDAEDALAGPYTLEVSSPGLERRFFAPDQLAAYLGRTVEVELSSLVAGRRRLRGTLASVDADSDTFTLTEQGGKPASVAWRDVKLARLVHEFY
jgi:ribosome maturation factor RimP